MNQALFRGAARVARLAVLVLVPVLLAVPGCKFNKLVADNMASSLKDMQAAFNQEESPRQAREASPALLSQLDGFIVSSPENEDLLLAGAEMNASAAFAFFEIEDEDWARACYRKAKRYALRALAERDEDLRDTLVKGDEQAVRKALAAVKKGDDRIPALFWTGFGWGSEINVSKDDMDTMADLPKVVALMEHLLEIAPDYYFAGPHLFMAVYYSSRGPAIGGDLTKAHEHYHEVFKRTNERMLMPYVLYAEFYAVTLGGQDSRQGLKEFDWAIAKVLDAPRDLWPEQGLANAIARQSAEELAEERDDLILPPLPDEE
ncbi:MAG: TRAP transporter TatT component family protein [Planctomycetota bacterium]|jgi:hypothetical protein